MVAPVRAAAPRETASRGAGFALAGMVVCMRLSVGVAVQREPLAALGLRGLSDSVAAWSPQWRRRGEARRRDRSERLYRLASGGRAAEPGDDRAAPLKPNAVGYVPKPVLAMSLAAARLSPSSAMPRLACGMLSSGGRTLFAGTPGRTGYS